MNEKMPTVTSLTTMIYFRKVMAWHKRRKRISVSLITPSLYEYQFTPGPKHILV